MIKLSVQGQGTVTPPKQQHEHPTEHAGREQAPPTRQPTPDK